MLGRALHHDPTIGGPQEQARYRAQYAHTLAADLVLKRVMLSTAGFGYFEYEAAVDGPGTLGIDVKLDQVDDVLKLLVVFDEAGGVGGIELPGRDDTYRTFGDVPFGPEGLASPPALLNGLCRVSR